MIRRALALAAAAVLGSTTPAAAAQESGDVSGELVLASQDPWIKPDGEMVILVRPVSAADPDDLELSYTVHRRVTSRSQFTRTLAGESLGTVVRSRAEPLTNLPPQALAVQVRIKPADLGITRTGVYPVALRLRHDREVVDTLVTHLVLVPATPVEPRLGAAVVAPVHAPPAIQPDGTRRAITGNGLAELIELLTSGAYRDLPLTLLPNPETVVGLAPEAIRQLRDSLAGRQVLARTFVPVDLGALIEAGLEEHVGIQLERGKAVIEEALGIQPDGTTWIADEGVRLLTLAELRGRQVDRLVMPDTRLSPVDELTVTLTQPFSLDAGPGRELPAVAADSQLAAHFSNGSDQVLAAHHLLADLAVLWGDEPAFERAAVVVPPRSWRPTRAFMETVLIGLQSSPLLEPMTLATVFNRVDPKEIDGEELVRQLEPQADEPLGIPATALRAARARVDALGSVLPSNSVEWDNLNRGLMVAEAEGLRPSQRRAYLLGIDREVARHSSQLELDRSRTVTLTAKDGEIPIAIRNLSDQTLHVTVRVESDKLDFKGAGRFSGGAEKTIEVLPSNNTLPFRVEAKAPGEFPLQVRLLSPRGGLLLADTRWRVRAPAFSGLGLVLSVGAGVFLAVWWGRHLVRGRRARRLVPT